MTSSVRLPDRYAHVSQLCELLGLRIPVLLAPMAGVRAPALSTAVMEAGGAGACGVLLMQPDEIVEWCRTVRDSTDAPFQLNTWIPDPASSRDPQHEETLRAFLSQWGPPVEHTAADPALPDLASQCDAMLDARPAMISSIMGLYPAAFISRMKSAGIKWLATVSTVREARAAEAAGADIIVAQGAEAGGHRGAFDASRALAEQVGLFSLLPAVVDAVSVPVIATGGIADERGVAAAIMLGASAVQIGSAFLRCPESGISAVWRSALESVNPEDTIVTTAFTGRPGRAIGNDFVRAAMSNGAPAPAPYPIQRALTAAMRARAVSDGNPGRMQMWAGQSAALGTSETATRVAGAIWSGAAALLNG